MKALWLVLALVSSSSAFADGGESVTSLDFEQENKLMQIRLEPHWLLLKEAAFDFQFKINSQFSLGPTVALMNKGEGIFYGTNVQNRLFMDDKTNRQSYGLRGVYYFNEISRSSAYLAGSGRYSINQITSTPNSTLTTGSPTEKGKFTEIVGTATGGYQWVWSGMFTMNVGAGISYYNHPTTVQMTDSLGAKSKRDLDSSSVSYALDAGLGIMF